MTITRHIFDESKQYFGRKYHSLKELFDWDVNEDWDEILFKNVESSKLYHGEVCFLSDSVIGGTGQSFYCAPTTIPSTTNFTIRHGFAVISGREVSSTLFDSLGSTFEFTSTDNYIVSGKVSSITAITPSVQYTLNDLSQLFEDISSIFEDAGGNPFRIRMTSGTASGSTFNVDGLLSDTSLRVNGDLSGVSAGDTYKLLPPALTVPVSSQTDHIYLCEYRHSVDERLDSDLEDPTLNVVPSVRVQSRWFIAPNWVDGSSINPLEGTVCHKIATITRTSGETINNTTLVNEELDYFYSSKVVANTVDNHADVLSAMDSFSAAYTPVIVEANYGDTSIILYEASFKKQTDTTILNVEEATFGTTTTDQGWRAYSVNTGTGEYNEHVSPTNETVPLDLGMEYNLIATVQTRETLVGISGDDVKAAMQLDARSSLGFPYYTRSADNTITVLPGTLVRNNRALHMPYAITLDVTDTANWYEGNKVTNEWFYIYAKPTSVQSRTLDLFFTEYEPNYDGRFKDVVNLATEYGVFEAFCVGICYIQELFAVETVIAMASTGSLLAITSNTYGSTDTISWREGRIPALDVITTGSTNFTRDLPACLSVKVRVHFDEISETSGIFFGQMSLVGATSSTTIVTKVLNASSTLDVLSQDVEIPKLPVRSGYSIDLPTFGPVWTINNDSMILYSSVTYDKDFWIPTALF